MSNKFRFASLLQWRERQRDEAGGAVGQAVQAINRIDEQSRELQSQIAEARSLSGQMRVGDVSVNRLLADGRFAMQLELELRSLAETKTKLSEALVARQAMLAIAEAEVKRFEKLREIDREREAKEAQRREQLSIDEAVTNRYLLNARKQASLAETNESWTK